MRLRGERGFGAGGAFERKHTFFSQFIFTLYMRPGFKGGVVGLYVIIKLNKLESIFSREKRTYHIPDSWLNTNKQQYLIVFENILQNEAVFKGWNIQTKMKNHLFDFDFSFLDEESMERSRKLEK